MTEDEMAGWHHGLDGRESESTPGDGDGQGGLVCCDSWGCKKSDMTELSELRQFFAGKVMSLLDNMLSRFGHSDSSKEQASFN